MNGQLSTGTTRKSRKITKKNCTLKALENYGINEDSTNNSRKGRIHPDWSGDCWPVPFQQALVVAIKDWVTSGWKSDQGSSCVDLKWQTGNLRNLKCKTGFTNGIFAEFQGSVGCWRFLVKVCKREIEICCYLVFREKDEPEVGDLQGYS